MRIDRFLRRCVLDGMSMIGLAGSAQPPRKVGTSVELAYPVLLIGQASLDVRESMELLTAVRGHSSLNLNERHILDSQGRLVQVKRAVLLPGQPSILSSMGNRDQLFFLELAELRRPNLERIKKLVSEQVEAPNSIHRDKARAVQEIGKLRDVKEIIKAVREPANWLL